VNKVKEFERFLRILNNKHRATLDALKAGKLTDEITDVIQTSKRISANITKV
jgi:F-type H+-transporting ATPase subunit alpha